MNANADSKIDRRPCQVSRFSEINDFDPEDWPDPSLSVASCLTPGYDIDTAVERSSRRIERKPRLDELDEVDQ